MDIDDLHDLPDDTDLKFAHVEKFARDQLSNFLHYAEQRGDQVSTYDEELRYMTTVLAAARVYEIVELLDWSLPRSTERQDNWNTLAGFRADAHLAATERRLRALERTRASYVKLPPAGKERLRRMLTEMRKTVEALDAPEARKRRLFAAINRLQSEVDRDRTNMEVVGGIFLGTIDIASAGVKAAEPILKAAERIGNVLNGYKAEEEEQKRLPPTEERQRLPAPEPKQLPAPKRKMVEADDEIPF
jgi:hypothetical protein